MFRIYKTLLSDKQRGSRVVVRARSVGSDRLGFSYQGCPCCLVLLGRALPSLALNFLRCRRNRKHSLGRAIRGDAMEPDRDGFVSCDTQCPGEMMFNVTKEDK